MDTKKKDLLEQLEQIYENYGFLDMSKDTFLKYVKQELQQYTQLHSIENEEGQNKFIQYIMSKTSRTNSRFLSKEEEKALLERTANGDLKAREILIERNIRLVKSRALKYLGMGLSLDDLMQEGMIALMTAIDEFDMTKGTRLTTYATSWIDGHLLNYLAEGSKTVRIQKNVFGYMKKVQDLETKLKRNLSVDDIVRELNVTKKMAQRVVDWRGGIASLNSTLRNPSNEDNTVELGDQIATVESVEDQFMIHEMQEETKKLLTLLSEKEQQILIQLYGLDGQGIRTATEIARKMNVTSQCINGIEARALKKIRSSQQILDMVDYMDDPENVRENIFFYREQYKDKKNKNKKNFEKPKEFVLKLPKGED